MEKIAAKQPIFTANFLSVCFASFGAFGSFYILLASLPVYIQSVGGQESEIGFVLGAFSVTATIVRPIAGMFADQRGKRGLMLGGIIVMLASTILYQLAQDIPILTALRILHGMGWGAFSTSCMALVADIIPVQRRGEGMGYYGIFSNVAMAVGPGLGVVVSESLGFHAMFWLSAGAATVGLVASFVAKDVAAPRRGPTALTITKLLHRRALFPSAVLLCSALSYSSLVSFLPLFAYQHKLGNPGIFFAVFAVVLIFARGPVGRLSDIYGRAAIIAPGLLASGAALVILSSATSMVTLLVVAFLYGLSFAAVQPTLQALTVDRVLPTERGSAMGTFSMAMDLGIGVGAFIWGVLIERIGFGNMYLISATAALFGCVIIVVGTSLQRKSIPVAD